VPPPVRLETRRNILDEEMPLVKNRHQNAAQRRQCDSSNRSSGQSPCSHWVSEKSVLDSYHHLQYSTTYDLSGIGGILCRCHERHLTSGFRNTFKRPCSGPHPAETENQLRTHVGTGTAMGELHNGDSSSLWTCHYRQLSLNLTSIALLTRREPHD
jgi:hypothetical protein